MLFVMERCRRLVILILAFALGAALPAQSQQTASFKQSQTASIPAAEFSRIVQTFSEEGGYFQSDNFTSNETSYLHVVPKLKELGVSGGAYIGVGPEQNFTYIAKVRPSIAFIIDIRRLAVIQHLFYKAVFHLAKDRAEFFSLLFSRSLSEDRRETKGTVLGLMSYIYHAPDDRALLNTNLRTIRQTIEHDFKIPLSSEDKEGLTYIGYVFWRMNLGVSWGSGFPSLADLIMETDLDGNSGNFLATEEDYQFLRNLQEQNRIIPVVGDFGGSQGLAAIAGYLKENGYTVSAFYTSNVEEYLYGDGKFGGFVANVRRLPINNRSVFIRAVKAYLGLDPHPAWVSGYRMITLLEKIPVFMDDYDHGRYRDYWDLVLTHYIEGTKSPTTTSPTPQLE
ncbi:MAG: hypothetical protein HY316_04790 [Acidobacteria bacterium]|nr:hypothetical protein [Acidobacteriota bacterium]